MNLRALCVCQASFQIAGKDGPRVTAWGETRSPPNKKYHLRAWDESEESFTKRIKKAVEYVNNEHNVAGLCRELPSRMHDLVHKTRGDRLRK